MAYLSSNWLYGFRRVAILLAGAIGAAVVAAQGPRSHSVGVHGDIHVHELTVAITCASPPYYYLNGTDGGREWSLIAAVFQKSGYPATALYIPMSEAVNALEEGWIDAVWACGNTEAAVQNGFYFSEPLIPRQFIAITLADSGMSIDTVADLVDKKVVLHPEVEAVMGDPLQDMEHQVASLRLISNHALLAMMLFTGQVDVVVAEKSTFEYYRKKLPKAVHPERPLVFHPVFPPAYPRLFFADRTLRDEFNTARNALQEEYPHEQAPWHAETIRPLENTQKQVDQE